MSFLVATGQCRTRLKREAPTEKSRCNLCTACARVCQILVHREQGDSADPFKITAVRLDMQEFLAELQLD